jgi:hypothetical protein
MNDAEVKNLIIDFVNLLMPELTPYESSLYLFFIANTFIKNDVREIRIGKRTIAENISSSRAKTTNYAHVTTLVNSLKDKGCVVIGDTTRDGTLYTLKLPHEIPLVIEKMQTLGDVAEIDDEDYFHNPEKRKELFERDNHACFYCGETVTADNSTLDHLIPQWKGGAHSKDNLKTACLTCNSIKSGKNYEEAAPLLLKRIQDKRGKNS